MKNIRFLLFLVLVLILSLFVGFTSLAQPEQLSRKIIVFKDGVDERVKEELLSKVGGVKVKTAEVQQKLEQAAIDLGTPGKDSFYGSGLINAVNVTQ